MKLEKYLQHNSGIADGLDGLGAALKYFEENGLVLKYDKLHKYEALNIVISILPQNFSCNPSSLVWLQPINLSLKR